MPLKMRRFFMGAAVLARREAGETIIPSGMFASRTPHDWHRFVGNSRMINQESDSVGNTGVRRQIS